ncbi:alkaline phosphatase [Algoriphagus litoralis]|uniref:alkaline phosphatase n=1 Tax=Algoriphagus litoralis TaxID=2202829 RepID=UPI0018E579B1|nr:alkaline phosphatase [Algoriphagus litoralis]
MENLSKSLFVLFFLLPSLLFAQQDFKLHSHNDYLRNVPFWEAFGAGAASIEVDVILQDGSLMVAHEKESIQPERTLRSLYLEPIRKAVDLGMIEEFGFHLLVDCKTEGYATLEAIVNDAADFEEMLYSAQNPSGLKLIISGNRPKPEDYTKYPEWVFFDYQSKILTDALPWEKIGMVSLSFRQFSIWNGKGRIVEEQKKSLDEFIGLVHSFEKPVRFWAAPDSKSAWKAFYDMGVDYINTDQPAVAQIYLSTLSRNVYATASRSHIYQPTFASDGTSLPVKNIILLIGDGNGLAQISAGLFANGGELNLSQLKNMGLVKTQAADDFTTDSAAGATAYATGKKTNNRALGVAPDGTSLPNLPKILASYGFSSGIITTDQLTGATPASFYAHHSERDDSEQIASYLPVSKLDLFIGGGKKAFGSQVSKLESTGVELLTELDQIADSKAERVGFFSSEGSNPTMEKGRGDFLSKSALAGTAFLKAKNQPFFLMIESAMIDSGGHSNSTSTIVEEMIDFDQVIGEMIRFADENPGTLLIITADHETGGVSLPQGNVETGEVELAYHSDDHTGILVPIFAYGPHSGDFRGIYENAAVFDKVMELVRKYHSK